VSNFHFGDNVYQRGNNNIGVVRNQDPQALLAEFSGFVAAMRGQVPEGDRAIIDESMETIQARGRGDTGALRRALGTIAGIAAIVGDVGVPVIDAVRQLSAALGI
jgi:hypothetical protein